MREDRGRDSRGMRDRNFRRDHPGERSSLCGSRRGLSFFRDADTLGACREPQPACGQLRGNVSLTGAKGRGEIPMTQETLPGTTDRRLAGLLTLLAENATIVISGSRIVKEIRVSLSLVRRMGGGVPRLGLKSGCQP